MGMTRVDQRCYAIIDVGISTLWECHGNDSGSARSHEKVAAAEAIFSCKRVQPPEKKKGSENDEKRERERGRERGEKRREKSEQKTQS